MKTHRSITLFTLLALAGLLLAACQSSVLETANPQAGAATQPVAAGTEAPVPAPTETMAVAETAAPTGEDAGLPPTGMQVPEGWGVLSDPDQGYSLAYPPQWEACEEHPYSRIFCEVEAEPAGLGPKLRLYVSVVPQDYDNANFDVYNFIPIERVREFMALPVGEALLKEPNATPPEYFTYTRLPDRMVAGWSALVIENAKVWEFPPETKERVIFIVTEGTTYTIGMYYETPEQLAMFEQVLDSFQLVP